MGIVAKYKFNQTIYADFIPQFNTEFTDYTVTDEIGTDGMTIRTIESDSLPTLIRFGSSDTSGSGNYTKQHSLLEILEINTSNVTNMSLMFYQCKNLLSINCNFDTSQVTNMYIMFNNCSSLTSLDVSNFDTSSVINMDAMFNSCSSLTSLDISNFNTEKVTNMNSMFRNCSSLISLDVSNFNTSKVTNMSYMFQNCSSLTSLDASNFDTSQVTNMQVMFDNCSSLISLDVSNFDTSKVTNMNTMFNNCSKLTSLDVSNFNTSKVTNMGGMFSRCSSLTSLDVSNFNTSQTIDMNTMFYNCSSLTLLDISKFDTSNVNTSSMFTNTKNLIDIGMIYCNSDTISKISDLITTNTTIWYMDSKLEDLTKKSNITYKEYKMNILESDEEIVLRRVGGVYDELNLETGELTQRIGEIVLDGSEEGWSSTTDWESDGDTIGFFITTIKNLGYKPNIDSPHDNHLTSDFARPYKTIATYDGEMTAFPDWFGIRIFKSKLETPDINGFKKYLKSNNLTVMLQLTTPVIKTINLEGKPSIDWQGDTYIHLENNTLYPQLDCEIESINYYEIPKLKANTLYTLRYVGEPTQCIFCGLTYKAENNMILTSGSSDNLLYFDKEVRKVILIEGDVRDRNFDYFEGIESLGAVEIVTHKTNMPIFAKGGRK